MNYLAHALPFLDEPYLVAGSAVPDWLTVADRDARVRPKMAWPLFDDPCPATARVARGVVQHVHDDRQFHGSRAFVELSLELTAMVRHVVGADEGFRVAFLGHLLVEVLLDGLLAADAPEQVDAYYRALDDIDAALVERAVNRMVGRPTERLAPFVARFRDERILWDYLEDARLFVRLNQVMRRVGLAELPDGFRRLLPAARAAVDARRGELLEGIPAEIELAAPNGWRSPG